MGPEAIVPVNGADVLSFAGISVSAPTMLDPAPFGYIGFGAPGRIAASLAFPGRPLAVRTGDGAFGFNAIEGDTAFRHRARASIVATNNAALQIGAHDETVIHGKVVGTGFRSALMRRWREPSACTPSGRWHATHSVADAPG